MDGLVFLGSPTAWCLLMLSMTSRTYLIPCHAGFFSKLAEQKHMLCCVVVVLHQAMHGESMHPVAAVVTPLACMNWTIH